MDACVHGRTPVRNARACVSIYEMYVHNDRRKFRVIQSIATA